MDTKPNLAILFWTYSDHLTVSGEWGRASWSYCSDRRAAHCYVNVLLVTVSSLRIFSNTVLLHLSFPYTNCTLERAHLECLIHSGYKKWPSLSLNLSQKWIFVIFVMTEDNFSCQYSVLNTGWLLNSCLMLAYMSTSISEHNSCMRLVRGFQHFG